MHTRITLLTVAVALSLVLAAAARADDETPPPKKPKLEYLYVSVAGAKTPKIAEAVQKRVQAVRGVQSFAWTAAHTEAKIVRVVGQPSTPTLVAAFKEAGVLATAMDVGQTYLVFAKKKPDCGGCVNKVRTAILAVKGTKEVLLKPKAVGVTVVYDKDKVTPEILKRALSGTPYPVKP